MPLCKIYADLSSVRNDTTDSFSIKGLSIVSLVVRALVTLRYFIVNNLIQIINTITLKSYRAVCEMRIGVYILILPAEVLDEWLLLDKGINLILVDRF